MKGKAATKWGVVLLCALFAIAAVGCAKKQTVKSQEGAAAGAAGGAAGAAGGPSGGTGGTGGAGDVKGSSIPTEKVEGGSAAAGAAGKGEGGSAPMTPAQVAKAEAAAGEIITKEEKSPFEDIRFDFDEYAIRPDAKPVLEKVADHLRKNKGVKVLVEGHCDERGTNEYNMALGERRAEATKKYLVSLGVPASALSTVSLGEEKPLDPGHDEVAWAKNRRAHFVLR